MLNSRDGLLEREREIMKLINLFLEQGLDFIVVGGYAISTFKKRFSVDLDLVIHEKNLKKFEELLIKRGYSLSYDKNIALFYGEKFERFAKKISGLSVCVDLLINGLVSRTTDSNWNFDYIKEYSGKGKLNDLEFLIPKKELLAAMKFHSGRLQDIRDIVALMPCDKEKIKKHFLRGDIGTLKKIIKRQEEFLKKPQFDDSFKGIFGIHVYKKEDVEKAKDLIERLLKLI